MKILIAGATGLIGKELVKQCREEGILVHYLTTSKDKIENEENYQGFYWNPTKSEIDIKAFEGVSAVINLAGASVSKRWTSTYKEKILQSRLQTAGVLFASLQEIDHTVTQYISASGISIYPSSLDNMYEESTAANSDSFLNQVSFAWEAAADQFSSLGMLVSKLRTGIVLSKKNGALSQIVKPIKMGVGAPLASGKQWQSWIHIADIAGMYLFLVKNSKSGVYNGVAPSPVTNKKMTKVIANHLNKPLWLPNVPAFMLKIILGEMADLVLESQLVSTQKIEAAGYKFQYVNLELAIKNLL